MKTFEKVVYWFLVATLVVALVATAKTTIYIARGLTSPCYHGIAAEAYKECRADPNCHAPVGFKPEPAECRNSWE